jgi:hypothetical protein
MSTAQILQKIQQHQSKHPELLKQLGLEVKSSPAAFDALINSIRTGHKTKESLRLHIQKVFYHKDLTYALVESGISRRTGFTSEIIRKIKHSILP